MSDPYESLATGLTSPARELASVTKDDATDLPKGVCRALLVGTPGTANMVDAAGNTLTNVPLQQGYNLLRVARIKTGGTAGDIWALY
ncbi:MAG: spike base protein, RCAP_Rcc01079 family [Alphaproteobacteria bacterium]